MSCDGIFTLEHTMAHKTGHADKDAFEYEESTHFGRSSDESSPYELLFFHSSLIFTGKGIAYKTKNHRKSS